ncbi:hypothetical protein EDB92DRAFT_393729 [Lactarius akahatsu]|uniref:Uncharacterized protein n=1 Tax=Lactarius akahatsu TaxID=416441 RepID=A0AAD4LAT6_9AGAM|nr:hypothetical protein EDB92DRAFT_393729 [Lactarius akahatsu]
MRSSCPSTRARWATRSQLPPLLRRICVCITSATAPTFAPTQLSGYRDDMSRPMGVSVDALWGFELELTPRSSDSAAARGDVHRPSVGTTTAPAVSHSSSSTTPRFPLKTRSRLRPTTQTETSRLCQCLRKVATGMVWGLSYTLVTGTTVIICDRIQSVIVLNPSH